MNPCTVCNSAYNLTDKVQFLDENKHLESYSHIRALKKMFCHFCCLQFISMEEFNIHQTDSTEHQQKIIIRNPDHPLINIPPLLVDLADEVDFELKRILYYLYFSNAFPYDVSLEYLKYFLNYINSNCQEDENEIDNVSDYRPLETLGVIQQTKSILEIYEEYIVNTTRINILNNLENVIIQINNLMIERGADWSRENILKRLRDWNENLNNVIEMNHLLPDYNIFG